MGTQREGRRKREMTRKCNQSSNRARGCFFLHLARDSPGQQCNLAADLRVDVTTRLGHVLGEVLPASGTAATKD
jgi:hypothetical protein